MKWWRKLHRLVGNAIGDALWWLVSRFLKL